MMAFIFIAVRFYFFLINALRITRGQDYYPYEARQDYYLGIETRPAWGSNE